MDDIIINNVNISDIIYKNSKEICIVMTFLFIIILIILIKVYRAKRKRKSKLCQVKENKPEEIIEISNFLSNEECDKLLEMGLNRFVPSQVYGKESMIVDRNVRTSSNAHFTKGENDFIKDIENRVGKICNVNVSQLEAIQLGKYTKGQQYKYHHDYFDKDSDQNHNQRIKTFLLYLNTLKKEDGGETDFFYLDKSFSPVKGKAVIWNNKIGNELNGMCLHSGKPILSNSTKYIMTIWIREKDL